MSDDHKAEAVAQLIWETKLAISGSAPATRWDDVKSSPARHSARVVADAILARFNVTERDEGPWEFRCTNAVNTSPCAPGHDCGGKVERRFVGNWFPALTEGERR